MCIGNRRTRDTEPQYASTHGQGPGRDAAARACEDDSQQAGAPCLGPLPAGLRSQDDYVLRHDSGV